jgi:hypothetical protein
MLARVGALSPAPQSGGAQLMRTGVAVEKLFLAKFAKMKLRQDAL